MTETFREYEKTQRALTFSEMEALHDEIVTEIGNDEESMEIYAELVQKAAEYSAMRTKWMLSDPAARADMDASRTAKHDSLIVKLNMLARFLKMQGKTAGWRETLGYEEDDPYNRKRIGDFGCYLSFVAAVNAR